jgi:nucleoside-diphosphate kinase
VKTLILIKPDAVVRGLTGDILERLERKGLRARALQQITASRDLAVAHYAEHAERPFFDDLVAFITSGPLVAMIMEGENAVLAARQVIGATDPLAAAPGTIRGDLGLSLAANLVHGSDSEAAALRECALFFPPE